MHVGIDKSAIDCAGMSATSQYSLSHSPACKAQAIP